MASVVKKRYRQREAGFTLMEVLVAFTLFGLLSMLLLSALRLGTAAWHRSDAHAARLQDVLHAQTLLRRLIGNAYPLFVTLPAARGFVDFEGNADTLIFLSEGPMSLGSGGRFRFSLSAAQHDRRTDLVLDAHPELAIEGSSSASPRRTVMADLAAVEFAYFGTKRRGEAAQWHSEWGKELELPQLVRIKVTFADGDAGVWPDLIVRPAIEVDVSCVYDRLAKSCRGR